MAKGKKAGKGKGKGKKGKKGKDKEPEEEVEDTDVPYMILDAKKLELLTEAADWMGKKEKGFNAEITALEKANAIPVKKQGGKKK
mmetsp:Transcript_20723/g.65353  ORF Transcript_20723/g.65353 Transcript_20723/m.65353 type:complete len:85 (-) Transcript_20723:286-540(-)